MSFTAEINAIISRMKKYSKAVSQFINANTSIKIAKILFWTFVRSQYMYQLHALQNISDSSINKICAAERTAVRTIFKRKLDNEVVDLFLGNKSMRQTLKGIEFSDSVIQNAYDKYESEDVMVHAKKDAQIAFKAYTEDGAEIKEIDQHTIGL